MKFSKIAIAALGLLALSACAQPPTPPAYVEVPWKGNITPVAKFAPSAFTINFRSGSIKLSKADAKTIRDAADAYAAGGSNIQVTGFTDTVGKPKANQALSDRRANAVSKALVKAGVPASAIAKSGLGETQLAVATGDKVSEQANRRVVIDIR
ncbi:MAG: OmpA family protein [Rhodospirillaceae bacterium]